MTGLICVKFGGCFFFCKSTGYLWASDEFLTYSVNVFTHLKAAANGSMSPNYSDVDKFFSALPDIYEIFTSISNPLIDTSYLWAIYLNLDETQSISFVAKTISDYQGFRLALNVMPTYTNYSVYSCLLELENCLFS